ncbi:GDSL-type esterase/lipase family protein [Amnibacterium setariae]|uniref:G-D-S-L family lipolytic protein n=1 Tax=Amnibacterium setariae TaxID=2306585 RepID=A0A3A1TXJ5_9MICO|nr:GDSL-type esterase/lipase family protein [Amnibacterium setariae]RIX28328.1 G-D-S-L family lipolytic protein [Amnibacterium setariae]
MTVRDVRVCFAGDSLVAGTGDEAALGWVGRVAAAGIARGMDLTAYNLGVRGATSVQTVRRLAIEARPRLTAAEDPRVVLSFGANDTHPDVGLPPAAAVDALREAQRRLAPVPLLLVGPPAVDDDEQNERLRLLEAALAAEAAALGVPFVPVLAATAEADVWRRPVHSGDGFHPDAAGYALLAALVTEPLLAWLAAPPVAR